MKNQRNQHQKKKKLRSNKIKRCFVQNENEKENRKLMPAPNRIVAALWLMWRKTAKEKENNPCDLVHMLERLLFLLFGFYCRYHHHHRRRRSFHEHSTLFAFVQLVLRWLGRTDSLMFDNRKSFEFVGRLPTNHFRFAVLVWIEIYGLVCSMLWENQEKWITVRHLAQQRFRVKNQSFCYNTPNAIAWCRLILTISRWNI